MFRMTHFFLAILMIGLGMLAACNDDEKTADPQAADKNLAQEQTGEKAQPQAAAPATPRSWHGPWASPPLWV